MRSNPASRTGRAALAAVALLAACGTAQPPATEATAAAHVAVATDAAGADLGPLLGLCRQPPATKPPQAESDQAIAALIGQPPPPPGRAFDNLYYVGARWVSAWALTTSDGIILFDALNNRDEAGSLIDAGLRKLGLDPAQIKVVIVTHGHGDHYGGVDYLVERYHPKVVMSGLDWTMTETRLEFDTPLWNHPPKRRAGTDVAAGDGDRITLGDTTVTLYLTPGHTLGTLSPVFDVRANGQPHRVLLWGGTAFNFGRDLPRLDSYARSTERMREVARRNGIDVLLSNHSMYDGSLAKLDQMRGAGSGPANPFVLGTPTVVRALTVMGECARATRDRFAMAP